MKGMRCLSLTNDAGLRKATSVVLEGGTGEGVGVEEGRENFWERLPVGTFVSFGAESLEAWTGAGPFPLI